MKSPFPSLPVLQGAFEPWPCEGEIYDLVVEGTVPADLRGTFYRNGPNPQFVLNEQHHHFDGDGMIHAFEFSDQAIRYYNKWVRTERFALERAAGRSLFGGMVNRWQDPSVKGRSGNVANTNVIWHAGRLLALFEAGLPIEIDPLTLETIGPWTFNGALDRPMTAHPKIDPVTGDLLFYSYVFGASRELVFYRANNQGTIIEKRVIPTPYISMIHDFAMTENFVIFPVFPLTIDMEKARKGEPPIAWQPQLGTHFIFVPRNGDQDIQIFETDACFAFHFMNAYECGTQVVLDGIVIDSIPDDAKPFQGETDDFPTCLMRWQIDMQTHSVRAVKRDTTRGEMPRIDERFLGKQYRHGYFAGQLDPAKPGSVWNAVIHYDHETEKKKVFAVSSRDVLNEPVFVAKASGAEGEGYILTLRYNSDYDRSDLLILDAMEVDKSPLATVKMPHRVPFGFHGVWVPRLL
jgi:carotenoid cleavage dioxygenase